MRVCCHRCDISLQYHYKMIMKEARFAAGNDKDRGNHWVW